MGGDTDGVVTGIAMGTPGGDSCCGELPARSASDGINMVSGVKKNLYFRFLTLPIALLVWAPLDSPFPFSSLRIDTFFGDPILDAAKTRTGVVTFLAGFLTVCAGVLDLLPFRSK
jgi:hypothetical protein